MKPILSVALSMTFAAALAAQGVPNVSGKRAIQGGGRAGGRGAGPTLTLNQVGTEVTGELVGGGGGGSSSADQQRDLRRQVRERDADLLRLAGNGQAVQDGVQGDAERGGRRDHVHRDRRARSRRSARDAADAHREAGEVAIWRV